MEKSIEMYDGKVFGIEVSEYALEEGYLDFRTLAKMLEDCILNNAVRSATMEDWRIVAGEFDEMVMQDFIISKYGYELLKESSSRILTMVTLNW